MIEKETSKTDPLPFRGRPPLADINPPQVSPTAIPTGIREAKAIEVELTEAETVDAAKKLSALVEKKEKIELMIARLSRVITRGKEFRRVDCSIWFDQVLKVRYHVFDGTVVGSEIVKKGNCRKDKKKWKGKRNKQSGAWNSRRNQFYKKNDFVE